MWYSWERFPPSIVKFACFQPVRIMMFTQVGNPDIAISRLPNMFEQHEGMLEAPYMVQL